jgi:allophanate hydrolase subunit 1
MALTAIERKVLKAARESIRAKRHEFVCHAIEFAQVPDVPQEKLRLAKARLCSYVSNSIGGFSTLGIWIAHWNRGHWKSAIYERNARIAWITWMLGEKVKFDPNGV